MFKLHYYLLNCVHVCPSSSLDEELLQKKKKKNRMRGEYLSIYLIKVDGLSGEILKWRAVVQV